MIQRNAAIQGEVLIEELQALRDRQRDSEARLEAIECALVELKTELTRLAQLIRGNGEHGIVTQLNVHGERIDALRRQWWWVLWVLGMMVVGMAGAVWG